MALVASACTSASVSVSPSPVKCQVSLATSTPAVNAEGGNGSVAVTTGRECSWSVSSQASWIAIASPASGQGEGTVEYRISANLEPVVRTGAIAVNDQRAEITQAAGACQFTIAPTDQAVTDTGGTASVAVTAASNCAWTAVSNASWITTTDGSGGTGSGTVNFTVAANAPGTPRAGTLTVAGQTATVTQGPATPGNPSCSYSISPISQSAAAASGPGAPIAITTIPGCAWTATSGATWITNVTPGSGTGNGTVNFTIGANPAAISRQGTLTVAGTSFTVSQQGVPCSYSINPTSQSVAAAGGPGSPVAVTAPAGCDWTATSGTTWIANVTSNGSGNGPVNFTVAANTGPLRTGSLTIAGQASTVTQANGCSFTLNPPTGQTVIANAASYLITITASNPACGWTASVTSDFPGGGLFIIGASGFGSGTTAFAVTTNLGPTQRVGTLTIAGQTFEVTQARGLP